MSDYLVVNNHQMFQVRFKSSLFKRLNNERFFSNRTAGNLRDYFRYPDSFLFKALEISLEHVRFTLKARYFNYNCCIQT